MNSQVLLNIEISTKRLFLVKNGHDYKSVQKYHCEACRSYGNKRRAPLRQAFKGEYMGYWTHFLDISLSHTDMHAIAMVVAMAKSLHRPFIIPLTVLTEDAP
jgi:transposase-like protein